jgi:hypothetical protein
VFQVIFQGVKVGEAILLPKLSCVFSDLILQGLKVAGEERGGGTAAAERLDALHLHGPHCLT